MSKKLFLIACVGFSFFSINSYAVDCTNIPSCDVLGYTNTEENCIDEFIRCPFDVTKVSCTKNLYTKDCDTIGDILYGDGSCAISPNQIESSLVPIGIVFDVNNRLAVALHNVEQDGANGKGQTKWSENNCDIEYIENCTNKNEAITSCSTNGSFNTESLLEDNGGCSGVTYIANTAHAFQPKGCNKNFCKRGQWFIPSLRDLNNLYQAKDIVNNSLGTLSLQGASTILDNWYWSSTEHSYYQIWILNMETGDLGTGGKVPGYNYFRPVVKY